MFCLESNLGNHTQVLKGNLHDYTIHNANEHAHLPGELFGSNRLIVLDPRLRFVHDHDPVLQILFHKWCVVSLFCVLLYSIANSS